MPAVMPTLNRNVITSLLLFRQLFPDFFICNQLFGNIDMVKKLRHILSSVAMQKVNQDYLNSAMGDGLL